MSSILAICSRTSSPRLGLPAHFRPPAHLHVVIGNFAETQMEIFMNKVINTNDLIDTDLDRAVAKCENKMWLAYENAQNNGTALPVRPSEFMRDNFFGPEFSPSTDWSQAGSIIEREMLLIQPEIGKEGSGNAWSSIALTGFEQFGATPLIAAMRCYVASKMGNQIKVPIKFA
jgi:hypothetical protein